jgi:hypothetical protein
MPCTCLQRYDLTHDTSLSLIHLSWNQSNIKKSYKFLKSSLDLLKNVLQVFRAPQISFVTLDLWSQLWDAFLSSCD